MDPDKIAQLVAAFAFFGLVVIVPLSMLFLRHQRAMAELIHGKASNETLQRLEILERELRELRAAKQERVLREDDQRELGHRIT